MDVGLRMMRSEVKYRAACFRKGAAIIYIKLMIAARSGLLFRAQRAFLNRGVRTHRGGGKIKNPKIPKRIVAHPRAIAWAHLFAHDLSPRKASVEEGRIFASPIPTE